MLYLSFIREFVAIHLFEASQMLYAFFIREFVAIIFSKLVEEKDHIVLLFCFIVILLNS